MTKRSNLKHKGESVKKVPLSNIIKLDSKDPIPFESPSSGFSFTGIFNNQRGYLPFLDNNDNFFNVLLESKLLSPTNNACVNSKALFSIGEGLYSKEKNKDSDSFFSWSKRVNNKGESFNSLLKSIFLNHYTVGNNFIEIIRGGIGNDKYIRVINRSFLDCRLSVPSDDDICEYVILSRSFRTNNIWDIKRENYKEVPLYYGGDSNFKWFKNKRQEHCFIHVKNNFTGYDYYGLPDNVSSLEQQVLEHKISRSNIDKIENGLVVGGLVILDSSMTQEEAEQMSLKINSTYKGEGNTGKWAFLSNKDPEKSKIVPFNVQQEGSFIEIDQRIESKIVDSNNWDASLYGQHKHSGIGNGGYAYLSAVFESKNKTVINPVRNHIKEAFLRPFLEICDDWMGTHWSDLDLEFKNISPVSFMGSLNVNNILTKDEGRDILGFPSMNNDLGSSLIENKNVQNK